MTEARRPPVQGRRFLDNRKADGFKFQENNPSHPENQLNQFAAGIARSEFCEARAWHPDEWGGFEDRKPGERRSVKHYPNTWHHIGNVAGSRLRDLLHQEEGGSE